MPKVSINAPAPDFTLKDYEGRPVTLSDFKNKQNVLLVFNRGFMWPYCQAHMAQLRQDYEKFLERDTTVLVIGPEKAKQFASFFAINDLPFPGLPDPKGSVLKRYGQEIKIFKFGRMPAQALIDKEGIIRFVHYGSSMSDIPTTEEMLALIEDEASSKMRPRQRWGPFEEINREELIADSWRLTAATFVFP